MQHALVDPRAPKALVPHGGTTRIEVNQTDLVLVLWKNNQPELISHVSSGGGYSYCDPGGGCGNIAHTPDGNYKALSFLPGWVKVPLGEMFNPVFFIGRAYAIHGDTSVPLYAASHGCVRIPMDIANFFHTKFPLGTHPGLHPRRRLSRRGARRPGEPGARPPRTGSGPAVIIASRLSPTSRRELG